MADLYLRPESAGDDTGWTPNTGANYAAVDEETSDGDTTYVSRDGTTVDDLYNIPTSALLEGATISTLQVGVTCKYVESGTGVISDSPYVYVGVKTGGTEYWHAEGVLTTSSYASTSKAWTVNPADSAAWEKADVDALQIGIRGARTTGTGSKKRVPYVTQVWCRIYYTSGATYTLTLDAGSLALTGQTASFIASRKLAIESGSLALTGQDVTLTYYPSSGPDYTLTIESGSLALTGQTVSLLAARYLKIYPDAYTLTGQDLAFHLTRLLTMDPGSFVVTGESVALLVSRYLALAPGTYVLTGQNPNLYYYPYDTGGDMLTFGSLLDRIQDSLGDPSSATWARTTTIWQWACDALREFEIYRPKSVTITLTAAGHSNALPSDFRQVIYVEYPAAQYPPEYLNRRNHLEPGFFDDEYGYDVDRDYDAGEGYLLWTSKYLAIGESIIVRYAAAHTSSFSSELSTITVENHHVQIIINHVILFAYQERLAIQLQDPTAHTSTIQQMSDAVSKAEKVYLDSLQKALTDLSTSERVEGWKVDKFDRIY